MKLRSFKGAPLIPDMTCYAIAQVRGLGMLLWAGSPLHGSGCSDRGIQSMAGAIRHGIQLQAGPIKHGIQLQAGPIRHGIQLQAGPINCCTTLT